MDEWGRLQDRELASLTRRLIGVIRCNSKMNRKGSIRCSLLKSWEKSWKKKRCREKSDRSNTYGLSWRI